MEPVEKLEEDVVRVSTLFLLRSLTGRPAAGFLPTSPFPIRCAPVPSGSEAFAPGWGLPGLASRLWCRVSIFFLPSRRADLAVAQPESRRVRTPRTGLMTHGLSPPTVGMRRPRFGGRTLACRMTHHAARAVLSKNEKLSPWLPQTLRQPTSWTPGSPCRAPWRTAPRATSSRCRPRSVPRRAPPAIRARRPP